MDWGTDQVITLSVELGEGSLVHTHIVVASLLACVAVVLLVCFALSFMVCFTAHVRSVVTLMILVSSLIVPLL